MPTYSTSAMNDSEKQPELENYHKLCEVFDVYGPDAIRELFNCHMPQADLIANELSADLSRFRRGQRELDKLNDR